MKKYVVTFLFTPDFKNVWLIEKQKPEWQQGCLNGIGGKIESGELPQGAAAREMAEEAGVFMRMDEFIRIGSMIGTNNDGSEFQVYIFTGIATQELKTQEEEKIGLYQVDKINDYKRIENVPMLIETCLYRLLGHSYFYEIEMRYNPIYRQP